VENVACIPGPLTDAQRLELEDSHRSGVLPLNSTSATFETNRIVKKVGGKLYGASVFNQNAAARFVLIFDSPALPANGVAALATYPIAANAAGTGALGLYFGSVGRAFEQGIVIALSTTAGTLTIAGADMWCDAQYV
jgi:hypothetical protein